MTASGQLAKNTAGDHATAWLKIQLVTMHATCGQQLKIQLVTASGQLAKNTAGDSQWTVS